MPDNNPSVPKKLSLTQRAITAGIWTLGGHVWAHLLRLGGNLIMTRLLAPDAFGLMGVVMVIMTGLTMFSDFGLKYNIVQSEQGNDAAFLNTAWVAQILRGVVLFVIALIACLSLMVAGRMGLVPQGSTYADPVLPYVLAVMSFNFVIGGFQSTKLFEASRSLSLARVTKLEAIVQVFGLLCMFAWAMIDRSIWALVAGSVGWTTARVLFSHAYLPGMANRWEWNRTAFGQIFHFGKWVFLSSILGFLASNGDRLLLAGWVDGNTFGVYVIAFLIFGAIQQVLAKVISEVSFPAISEVARERPESLKSSYYKFHAVIGSLAYFCAGVLMVSGHALIDILYDPRYAQAGWILEILAVALLTVPFLIMNSSLLALGLPKLLSNISATQAIALYILMPLGYYFFGLPGAVWGLVASFFACVPTTIVYKIRLKIMDVRAELLMLLTCGAGILAGKCFNYVTGY